MVKGYWLKGIGMFSFERLDVYQKARELVKDVYQLQNAQDLEYIDEEDVEKLRPQFENIAKMLSGLKSSFEKKL